MRRFRRNTKGFTLMEVLISIAMVGILFMPLLTFFSHSSKLNINAKNLQRATTVAQSVMEEVRAYNTIHDMCETYEDSTNTDLKRVSDFGVGSSEISGGALLVEDVSGTKKYEKDKYYFQRTGIESDGKTYSAKIELDTTAYDKLNKEGVAVISSLGSGSTAMAVELNETMSALYEFQSRNWNKGGNVGIDELVSKLKKTIKISITDTSTDPNLVITEGMVHLRIYNEYTISDTSIPGCDTPILSANLYNEEVVYDKLKGIYIFYNYDVYQENTDILQGIDVDVNYTKAGHDKCDFTIYALCQKVYSVDSAKSFVDDQMNTYMTTKPVCTKINQNIKFGGVTSSDKIKVFSNFNYSVNGTIGLKEDMNNIIGKEPIQRLAKVTVTVFDENDKQVAELISTRGE